ncbi:TPA: NAD(P)H-dependent oxidoreductase [Candidatus Woesearchaeota archaeon]|nr:NAD(P)H-dependent oxidoreductase [Candidatus Woesearchaeota archaeon]HIH32597.1 NAD(P)H-dependent oxidoreductase [Candidatus Woesearchaeota archaeon]HIH54932.1 NAD(P)H-dependent oxidoreductase [Candidatus Woesearchaeota archaeon]HIJ01774.1 NAD(P)H-dependent oxidoreductase [Candidatus Woesearchaeota archaeon]HIJ14016.1 NAD(P)H-dependent oxidoreductase [Candidatus Woesearchaeota archaeon]
MKYLIIYAHPDSEGHCSTILSEVKKRLDEKKDEYEVIDLYKIKYDPVLTEEELYGVKQRKLTNINKQMQEKISKAERIILIYPVWWNSMPAILKGFFDRVFTSGFAFRYKPVIPSMIRTKLLMRWAFVTKFDYGIPVPLLRGKEAIVFLTTGSPKIAFFINGNRFKKVIKRDTLGFFGIKTKIYHIDNCRALNKYQIAKIKKNVKRAIN